MKLAQNALQKDKIPVNQLKPLGQRIEDELNLDIGEVHIDIGKGDRFDYQETREKLDKLDAMLGKSQKSDLPEGLEKVLEQDVDIDEPDNVVSINPGLPNGYVFAHEIGHIVYDRKVDTEFSPLIDLTLSEMVAEATAYHFTEYKPEQEVLERDPFDGFSKAESEELANMDDPYEEVKDNQYGGPIDIPHSVGCRLGAQLVENGGDPIEIIENASDYGEAVEEAVKETLEYAQNAENPDIEELDSTYEEILEGI